MLPHILIVDDERAVLDSTLGLLERLFKGRARFLIASDTESALALIEEHADSLAVAVVDYNLGEPKKTGERLLKVTRRVSEDIYNILNTAYGTKDIFKRGVNEGWLNAIAEKEGDLDRHVADGLALYAERYGRRDEFLARLSTSSNAFTQFISRVLEMRRPVQGKGFLLVGERGTGKEVIGELIHLHFGRDVMQKENCATYDNNAEMQLFGVAEKAFPNVRALQGAVRSADGGTLFLDEIHALDEGTQRKLNRLIEYGDYSPYGDSATKRHADCLLIAATNQPVASSGKGGWLNDDLRDRFIVFEIPPLRDRIEELPALISSFIEKHLPGKHWDGERPEPDAKALCTLSALPWPGNLRMVENTVIEALSGFTGIRPEEFTPRLIEAANKHHRDQDAPPSDPSWPRIADLSEDTTLSSLVEKTADILEVAMKNHATEGWNTVEKRLVNGALLTLCRRYGSQIEVSQRLRIPRATLNSRVKQAELLGMDTLHGETMAEEAEEPAPPTPSSRPLAAEPLDEEI